MDAKTKNGFSQISQMESRIGVTLAFLLLSVAWSPKMRKMQTIPRTKRTRVLEQNETSTSVDASSDFPADENDKENTTSATLNLRKKTARGKASVISSAWKLFLTPLVATLFCYIHNVADLAKLPSGFEAINTSNPALPYFLLQVVSSFLGYHLAWLACAICMQQIAFALPLTLATPVCLVITDVMGLCGSSAIPLECASREEYHYVLSAGMFLWIAQFLTTGYYLWKNQGLVMAKASTLFWLPSYNGMVPHFRALISLSNL